MVEATFLFVFLSLNRRDAVPRAHKERLSEDFSSFFRIKKEVVSSPENLT